MDALKASEAAPGATPEETNAEQPIPYPHLWFDDQGRPWIDDTNTKVIEVVCDYIGGWNAEEIHNQYPYLSPAQIHSALAYYYDHKQEFDAEIARDREEVRRLVAEAKDSPLRQRLRVQGKLP